jgi:hypothetical protein
MGSFGGYYKGEKKKPKKAKDNKSFGQTGGIVAPTFKLPELITKKKKNEW